MKRILALFVAVCTLLTVAYVPVSAAADVTADDYASLSAALTAEGTAVIEITGNITFDAAITVAGTKTLVTDGNYSIKKGADESKLLVVSGGAILNIGGVAEFTGSLVFDGDGIAPTADSSLILCTGAGSVANIYSGTFQKNLSYNNDDGAILAKSAGNINLYGGTVTKNDVLNTNLYGSAVVAIGAGTTVVIDGAVITSNYAAHSPGITANSGSTVIFNSGSITDNILSTDVSSTLASSSIGIRGGSKFTMNGGTVEGITFQNEATISFYGQNTVGEFNGGTIKNTGTAVGIRSNGPVITFGTLPGGNGIVMENCVGAYGGCIGMWFPGTVNVNAGTFRNSGGFARSRNASAVYNINGGRIENCGASAVDITNNNGTVNIGGSVSFDANSVINLGNAQKVNIVSNLTIQGAVAKINGGASSPLAGATPQLLADNAGKFVSSNGLYSFNPTTGAVDNTTTPLDFIWPQQGTTDPEIDMSFDGDTATVTSNYNAGEIKLIFASYKTTSDGKKQLSDVKIADITVNDNSVSKTVAEVALNTTGADIVKVMLWDSMDNIIPIADAQSN